jgi:Exopolysaccharide synthesis, ExoD
VLQEIIRQAPAEHVTVGWLTSTFPRHSFGVIMLCLGLLAMTPSSAILTMLTPLRSVSRDNVISGTCVLIPVMLKRETRFAHCSLRIGSKSLT